MAEGSMLLSFAAAILAIVSLFSPNFGKNVQFTHAGDIKVSYSSGFGLFEEAEQHPQKQYHCYQRCVFGADFHLLHPLSVKGGCLRWLSRSYRR